MYFAKITQSTLLAVSLMLGTSSIGALQAQSTDAKTKPDNSAVNKRDQNPDQATADQQKMNAADRDITAKIRKAVVADKSLSTYAHNVKIISQDGTVTLKGPVRSDLEVKSLVAKATDVTGSADKVINQLSVQPASK
jgi:hyperosmotically inducible protein